MNLVELGRTGLRVSRLCFGTLTMGPLQLGLPPEEGARLIAQALDSGVNFFDTADAYGTYPHLKLGLSGRRPEAVVATKSYAHTAADMRRDIERALRELCTDYLDIMLLHEQESAQTIAGHREALECLVDAVQAGVVRAAGVSTHSVACAAHCAGLPGVAVIHPLLNRAGIGLLDGTAAEMAAAAARARAAGQGVYTMKALAGGHLSADPVGAIQWVLRQDVAHSIAVGIATEAELVMNNCLVQGLPVPEAVAAAAARRLRRLHVEDWCHGCGECISRCPQGALAVEAGRVAVDCAACVLCGYCAGACRDFCLKVV